VTGGATAAAARPAPALRSRVRRYSVATSWLVVGALLLAFLAGAPTPSTRLQVAPLVASVVLFGFPHGAVDHLAVARASGRPVTARDVAGVVALYGVLGGAYAALWLVAPLVAAVAFVALTWAHWGQGDLYPLVALFDGAHPATAAQRALTAAVRGALPMVVPLVAFPATYRRVLGWFVAPFDGTTDPLAPLFAAETRLALGVGLAVLSAVALATGYRAEGASAAWVVDCLETGLLWAFFLVVPPILAVGAYFSLWHALRHVGRLVAVDDAAASALAGGDPLRALGAFAQDALPATLGGLLVVVALAAVAPRPPGSLTSWVGVYLVAIAVLTLPHVVVVTTMDRRQGVL
jgi:Brp/Blh family beta-carotene 15,15'-monooxygenase